MVDFTTLSINLFAAASGISSGIMITKGWSAWLIDIKLNYLSQINSFKGYHGELAGRVGLYVCIYKMSTCLHVGVIIVILSK